MQRSVHRVLLRLVVSALVVLGVSVQTATAEGGASGMTFLKLGISARGVAMADAMAASVTGASATYYNPAGLIPGGDLSETAEISLMHKEWIQDTRTEFLGAAVGLGADNAIGFSLNTTTVSDIEIRTHPGESQGTFNTRNLALGLSYAHRLADDIRVGVSARFLYEQILVDEASGIGGDVGLMYDTPVEGLTAGLTIANIGAMNALRTESSRLPLLARAGVAYPLSVNEAEAEILLAADLLHLFREELTLGAFGAEIVFARLVAVRAGYQAGSEGRGLSLGGGVQYGLFTFDYAFSRLAGELGNGHTLALGIRF